MCLTNCWTSTWRTEPSEDATFMILTPVRTKTVCDWAETKEDLRTRNTVSSECESEKIGPSSCASVKLFFSPLQVENPSCLWGRVARCQGVDAETEKQYENLLVQMNLFYHDVSQDLRRLRPTSFEEGQVMVVLHTESSGTPSCDTWAGSVLWVCYCIFPQICVVYWSVMKSWCRAMVESIIMDSVTCQVRCLLVDHGEQLVVSSDQ